MDAETRDTVFKDMYAQPTIDGKHIVEELCSCGHSRYAHQDRFSVGHGACNIPDCDCPQFTWVSWVLE